MGVTVRVTVNSAWPHEVDAAASRFLGKIAVEIENDAERYAPVKTGKLRASIYREVNDLTARIGVRDVPYWMTVEYGSGPHIIRPVNKKALSWPGAEHPVAYVNHPGTPVQSFLRAAIYKRRGA